MSVCDSAQNVSIHKLIFPIDWCCVVHKAHGKVGEENMPLSNQWESSMNSNAVVSAIEAISLATGEFAFAQGYL
jgi:hypothetical protein